MSCFLTHHELHERSPLSALVPCVGLPARLHARAGYFLVRGQWGRTAGWGRIFHRVTRMGSHIFGFFRVRQFFIFTVSKRTRMFVPQMKSKVFFIQCNKWVNS